MKQYQYYNFFNNLLTNCLLVIKIIQNSYVSILKYIITFNIVLVNDRIKRY